MHVPVSDLAQRCGFPPLIFRQHAHLLQCLLALMVYMYLTSRSVELARVRVTVHALAHLTSVLLHAALG